MNVQKEEYSLNMQSQITAMDSDSTGNLLIAGGRDFLKLIEVNYKKAKKMEIKLNLRRQGLKHAIGYLEFNKLNTSKFVAGSLQGDFSVWDITGHGTQTHLVKEHQAAIHRMNWSPKSVHTLISGGQDGLINIYDMNKPKETCLVHQIVRSQKDGVRDVKFNPFFPEQFLAATESGHFELYDMRQLNKYVYQKASAHSSLIYCIDWNKKNQNIVASGSTEKELKVWSINNSLEMEERVKIQLIDGAAQLRWHTINNSQQNLISVASLNRDVSVTTYDINFPFRPQTIVKGQKDLITSFVFNQDESIIITAAKDGIILMQYLDKCLDVYSTCPRYPVTFNQNNVLAYKLECPQQLDKSPSQMFQEQISNQSELFESEQFQLQNGTENNNQPSIAKLQIQLRSQQQSEANLATQSIKNHTSTLPNFFQTSNISTPLIAGASNQSPTDTRNSKDQQYLKDITGGGLTIKKSKPLLVQTFSTLVIPTSHPIISAPSSQQSCIQKIQPITLFNRQRHIWNPRPVTVVTQVDRFLKAQSSPMTLSQELDFLQMNYSILKNQELTMRHNSGIALKFQIIFLLY